MGERGDERWGGELRGEWVKRRIETKEGCVRTF